jgi:hypothetical protein
MPTSDATIIDLEEEEEEEGLRQEAAKKRNDIAIANFMMAFTSEGIIGLVYKAVTVDWPDGLPHLIVLAMLQRYMP